MPFHCPLCQRAIPPEQVNMSADKGYCPSCDQPFALSDTGDGDPGRDDSRLLETPPGGTWIRQELEGTVIGASTRSAGAFFLVPFVLAWGGGSLGGIYGSQLLRGEFDLLKSLFGLPFLAGTVFLSILTLMAVAGRIEILTGRGACLFVGVGPLGWRRPFEWAQVTAIRNEGPDPRQRGGQSGKLRIEFKEGLPLTVGVGLPPARQRFLVAALRRELSWRG